MKKLEILNLGIQIVNYNTKKYITKCINSILKDLKRSQIKYHIFVVDNNSKDDLSDIKKKYKDEVVSFFSSERNGGFGYGHNFLAKKYNANYILFVNPDVEIIQKNTIQRLYDYIEKNKEIGSLGVKNNSSWDHGNILPFNNLFRKTGISVCFPTNVISQVNRVQGSFFILHKPLFEILGGFDEKYFLYKEEEDLQYRIEKLGYKTIYNPTIMVFHVGGVVAKKRKHIGRSISYFIWKWLFKNPNNP